MIARHLLSSKRSNTMASLAASTGSRSSAERSASFNQKDAALRQLLISLDFVVVLHLTSLFIQPWGARTMPEFAVDDESLI